MPKHAIIARLRSFYFIAQIGKLGPKPNVQIEAWLNCFGPVSLKGMPLAIPAGVGPNFQAFIWLGRYHTTSLETVGPTVICFIAKPTHRVKVWGATSLLPCQSKRCRVRATLLFITCQPNGALNFFPRFSFPLFSIDKKDEWIKPLIKMEGGHGTDAEREDEDSESELLRDRFRLSTISIAETEGSISLPNTYAFINLSQQLSAFLFLIQFHRCASFILSSQEKWNGYIWTNNCLHCGFGFQICR